MRSRDMLRWLAATFLVAGLVYSCKKSGGGGGGNPCPQQGVAGASPSPTPYGSRLLAGPGYNDTIRGFIAARCTTSGCHGTNGSNGSDLTTYEMVKSKGQNSLTRMNQTGSGKMPKIGSVSSTEITTFKTWVNSGYPLDANGLAATPTPSIGGVFPTPASGTGTTVVAYDNRIAGLMSTYCVSCHATGRTPPALSTAAEVQLSTARIMATIRTGAIKPMPPASSPQLPPDAKQAFEQWAAAGYPMTSTTSGGGVGGGYPAAIPTHSSSAIDCLKQAGVYGTPTPYYPGGVGGYATPIPTPYGGGTLYPTPTPFR